MTTLKKEILQTIGIFAIMLCLPIGGLIMALYGNPSYNESWFGEVLVWTLFVLCPLLMVGLCITFYQEVSGILYRDRI